MDCFHAGRFSSCVALFRASRWGRLRSYRNRHERIRPQATQRRGGRSARLEEEVFPGDAAGFALFSGSDLLGRVATVSIETGFIPRGSSNALATTSGSNMHTQHVPKPSSVACIIIWSQTIEVSMCAEFMPSWRRTQASPVRAQTTTRGATTTLPRARVGAADAAAARSSGVSHTRTRVGWLLWAEGAMRPASSTAASAPGSTGSSR